MVCLNMLGTPSVHPRRKRADPIRAGQIPAYESTCDPCVSSWQLTNVPGNITREAAHVDSLTLAGFLAVIVAIAPLPRLAT